MTEVESVSQAEALNHVLTSYRTFLENIFALMRFLESELSKRGWALMRGSGYAVTRNGWGSGLASFASADWFMTEIGICLVQPGAGQLSGGYTVTLIAAEGLELLYFQVRWHEKSPAGPAVWFGRLQVTLGPKEEARKWEEYQTEAFKRIEPGPGTEADGRGSIRPFQVTRTRLTVNVTGTYTAVPVTELLNEDDVVRRLVLSAIE